MKTSCRLILLSALTCCLLACGGGGGGGGVTTSTPPPPPAPPPPPPGPTAAELLDEALQGLPLAEFYEVSFAALVVRDPEEVVSNFLTDIYALDNVGLNDLSQEYATETFEMYRVVLNNLATYDREALDAPGKISYDVYEWYLQDYIGEEPFFFFEFPATFSIFGVPRGTELFFTDTHPMSTKADAENYITRLAEIRTKFAQLAAHLRMQRDNGIVEPQITLNASLNNVAAIAQAPAQTISYYTAFRDRLPGIPGLSDEERQTLLNAALAAVNADVKPAYVSLRGTLANLLNSAPSAIGVGQYANGSDYYDYILKHHNTTNLTPAEIHALGLVELDRIHHEMRLIFDELGYPQNETLEQLYNRAAQDGGIVPAAQAKSTFEDIIEFAEANLDEAFDIFPDVGVVVVEDDFGGFYVAPSFDGTRPGSFFAGTTNDLPYFGMPSLTFHETVPGHHYQIALSQDLDLPSFRKLVFFTGYVEGWALYAERLAWELGWYENDPYGDLGRLQLEALRAARLVMDTGIHSMGWSFQRATTFNNENVGASIGSSQGAAGRYSVIPGQATAYMIGMLAILEMRQKAMDQLGEQFNLKEFHRVVISNGAMPMAILEKVVDHYIAEKLAEV
jgi:uncharacterized protein (DUF885 family)